MLLAIRLQGAMGSGNLQSVCMYVAAAASSKSYEKMIAALSHNQWLLQGMVAINQDPERARFKRLIEGFEEFLE